MAVRTQADVLRHFDAFAGGGRWQRLYDGAGDAALNYSFIVRRTRVEEILGGVLRPGMSVADIGCGTAVLARFVLDRGGRYHGIDVSQRMLDEARRLVGPAASDGRAAFSIGDIERLDAADRAYDVSVALGVLEYLAAPFRAVDEMVRVTRPGGSIVVSVPVWTCVDHLAAAMLSPIVTPAARLFRALTGRSRPAGSFTHHKYRAGTLDALFRERGCEKADGVFYNLEVAAYPLHRLAPRAALRLKRLAEPWHGTPLRIFATAYIGHYRTAGPVSSSALF